MQGGLFVVPDLLLSNVRKFFTLEGQIGQLKQQLASAREMQTSEVWPEIDSVQAFLNEFRWAISRVENRLHVLEQELADCGSALEASARALDEQDAAAAEALRQLVGRIGAGDAASETSAKPSTDVGTFS